eukprot:TRINITY_DN94235_c0_g1_i1.p1 TRINITY_DN94235_c0_g1~~TRINITY_DN94235_c0_g1_i1.p1  ORF type:complete len:168 (-),score=26.42 TRINITY_DN94235_c0_g1_i1:68-571(-)
MRSQILCSTLVVLVSLAVAKAPEQTCELAASGSRCNPSRASMLLQTGTGTGKAESEDAETAEVAAKLSHEEVRERHETHTFHAHAAAKSSLQLGQYLASVRAPGGMDNNLFIGLISGAAVLCAIAVVTCMATYQPKPDYDESAEALQSTYQPVGNAFRQRRSSCDAC